jgi:hypothetical protein
MNRRNLFIAVVWIVVGINFVFFVRRSVMSDSCNIDELLKKSSNSVIETTPNADHQRKEYFTAKSEAPTSRRNPEVDVDDNDEFKECETMEGQSATATMSGGHASKQPMWCMYKDEVALRVIVLTFNRHASLLKLLK